MHNFVSILFKLSKGYFPKLICLRHKIQPIDFCLRVDYFRKFRPNFKFVPKYAEMGYIV